MPGQMLRGVLKRLKTKGLLMECPVAVNPKFELGAVLSCFKNEQPILFQNVRGYSMPVVGGLYGNRSIILEELRTTTHDRIDRLITAIAKPRHPRKVEHGAVQEKIIQGNIDLLRLLPVPTSNSHDASPYLCAGMFIYRDPASKQVHMAVRRIQMTGGNRMNILVSPASPHLNRLLIQLQEQKKSLECAVVLGYDAPFLLASQISSEKYGLDKYAVDSALRGEPLELLRCRAIDLEIPAEAEIVLEGRIEPNRWAPEGPFAELMGYYSTVAPAPVMEVSAVTQRQDAIFQHTFPCREEHLAYGMIKEAEIYAALSHSVQVRDVNLTLGGGCRLHAVVSLTKRSEGDGKSAILGTLGAYKDIKHVVVVDDDVDIYDPREVEGAIASRVQASRDLVVIPGALGSGLEASHMERGITDKVGIDATRQIGEKKGLYEMAIIPDFDKVKAKLDSYFPNIAKQDHGVNRL